MQSSSQFTKAIHICIFMHFRGNTTESSHTLAESLATNPVVVRRLVAKLRTAGIITSVSGVKGGFYLSRPASEINLWDIYQAVRENDLFQKSKKINPECPVGSNLSFLLDDTFTNAELAMKVVLDKVNIADLTRKLSKVVELNEKDFR